ncbi:hypothetical protein SLEP1_g30190 [Rubroshorea leprosula]|uniref:Uncharacterized protein n=1 Tax=Rubroshorea leprosula TaxID=152421 RepID=A0AAV5K7V1_9ROSI|nr:hypothetical protein SLEP1_g30190 [Rubroshorea leprosula]
MNPAPRFATNPAPGCGIRRKPLPWVSKRTQAQDSSRNLGAGFRDKPGFVQTQS